MRVVIDANVVAYYYREKVKCHSPPGTGPAEQVIQRLGPLDTAIIDSGGRIKAEWGDDRRVDEDWFGNWYEDQLIVGGVSIKEVDDCKDLIRHLADKCGFPERKENRWYLCVARALSTEQGGRVVLVTEDVDFFDPTDKGRSQHRDRTLDRQTGCVTRYLLRKEGIVVRTIKGFLEDCRDGH